MNKFIKQTSTIIVLILLLNSCSTAFEENDITPNISANEATGTEITLKTHNGTGRLIFPSTENIGNTMEQLISGKKLKEVIPNIKVKEIKQAGQFVLQNNTFNGNSSKLNSDDDEFLSYAEYIKAEILATLPAATRAELEKDPDFESFRIVDNIDIEPDNESDSMQLGKMPVNFINDPEFESILNPKKEVQVGTKVYKYTEQGIVVVDEQYIAELDDVEYVLKNMAIEPNNTTESVSIDIPSKNHCTLIVMPVYGDNPVAGNGGGSAGYIPPAPPIGSNPLVLTTVNKTIPESAIRDIDYYSKGDGTWINWIGNVFGKKTIAVNKYSSRRRLKFCFYDRNYYIYHRIGAEIQMQKKTFLGVWLNTHADDVVLGFTGIDLKAEYHNQIESQLPKKNNQTIHPLFKSPFVGTDYVVYASDYDYVSRDMNKIFKTIYKNTLIGIKYAIKPALGFLLNENGDKRVSIYGIKNKDMFVTMRPEEQKWHHTRSADRDLHFQRWSGFISVSFDIDQIIKGIFNPLKVLDFKIDSWKQLSLHRGQAYGAVKYNGVWKAARITKDYSK